MTVGKRPCYEFGFDIGNVQGGAFDSISCFPPKKRRRAEDDVVHAPTPESINSESYEDDELRKPPIASLWSFGHLTNTAYRAELVNGGPLAGHFAGAISLMWFTEWSRVKAALMSLTRSSAMPQLGLTQNFLRYTTFIVERAQLSAECLCLALLYIRRFRESVKAPVTGLPTSEARLLIVALMTSNKYLDDVSYTLSTWSKISNIDCSELRRMEFEFLSGLNFDLVVDRDSWGEWQAFTSHTIYPVVDRLYYRR